MNTPNRCYITDLETIPFEDSRDLGDLKYRIKVNDKTYTLIFSSYLQQWTNDEKILNKTDINIEDFIKTKISNVKHILRGLIYNDKWPKEIILCSTDIGNGVLNVDKIIEDADYPRTPKEKLENLFMALFKKQDYDGSIIDVIHLFENNNMFWKILYFNSRNEGLFYLNTLIEREYIKGYNKNAGGSFNSIQFTFKGLEEAIKLTEEGQLSNNCFVAMSFDKDEDKIFFEAIKPACRETGFEAKRVDYEQYDSEKTINDAIISLLKQCKFCIADFTKQRDGVYFEAGYALGRGLKVIYTCREDYFKKSHFDTNHFPHIVYKTNEELKNKLIDKINAYIKD
jgi:nucleoside 2-deoxyribosyltransferase